MTRRNVLLILCAAAVLLVAGGLFASNMGFKLNRSLVGPGGLSSGTNTLGLPYNRQIGIDNAEQLIVDMRTTGTPANSVSLVSKFNPLNDSTESYTGTTPGQTPFALAACECYRTQVTAPVQYVVVGSHDPALACTLKGTGTPVDTQTGTNRFAQPYHATFDDALEMLNDANTNGSPVNCVASVTRFNPADDSSETYTGSTPGQSPFAVVPGECYTIAVSTSANCTWTPSHY